MTRGTARLVTRCEERACCAGHTLLSEALRTHIRAARHTCPQTGWVLDILAKYRCYHWEKASGGMPRGAQQWCIFGWLRASVNLLG